MNDKTTGTIKLSEAVKIVQVPVAGQPGRFVTGFLPMQTDEQPPLEKKPQKNTRRMKIVSICLIILVLLAGSGTFLLVHNKNSAAAPKAHTTPTRIVGKATPKATPTTASTIILADSLNQNIHNWQVGTQGTTECAFKDGAYHIINHDDQTGASALLPDETLKSPFSYTLTMAQIEGDTDSPNNQFGMILDASIENKDGNQIDKFYAFEVLNKDGGEYQFWKYDNSQDSNNPWTKLWNKDLGDEFHQGKGADKTNTFKVSVKDDSFTFTVNGKQIDTFKDSSFSSGSVGMMVNLKDSEVAFSNLLLASS